LRGIDRIKTLAKSRASGLPAGIASICSAHPLVLESAMMRACQDEEVLLIEATANQVNQFGGYTGMRPDGFARFVMEIADRVGLPRDRVVLGGDHLGPLVWAAESASAAMAKALDLVVCYVEAGFAKIHLDTSMRLGDDPALGVLPEEVIASRGAELCRAAEKRRKGLGLGPFSYVIGSEVPIPGGAQAEEGMKVTDPDSLTSTIAAYRKAFAEAGIDEAWKDVVAVVVQPGVEFDAESVHDYDRTAARDLVAALDRFPGLVFEGHSTDYQTRPALRSLVEDGVAVLKVGPALTHALRESLFSLELIETELIRAGYPLVECHLTEAFEQAMLERPEHWKAHHHGTAGEQWLARRHSYSDRSRYFYNDGRVRLSVERLFTNLGERRIPMTLLSQYLPRQYDRLCASHGIPSPAALVRDAISMVLEDYDFATTTASED